VAAVLNLADLVPAARYFAASATLGAAANAALLATTDLRLALATRFFTGFFLAGFGSILSCVRRIRTAPGIGTIGNPRYFAHTTRRGTATSESAWMRRPRSRSSRRR
jgi:hypothetical protein